MVVLAASIVTKNGKGTALARLQLCSGCFMVCSWLAYAAIGASVTPVVDGRPGSN